VILGILLFKNTLSKKKYFQNQTANLYDINILTKRQVLTISITPMVAEQIHVIFPAGLP